MKKRSGMFFKSAAVVAPLVSIIPQSESFALGENLLKNILYYLGYLNPVYWWECILAKVKHTKSETIMRMDLVSNESSKRENEKRKNGSKESIQNIDNRIKNAEKDAEIKKNPQSKLYNFDSPEGKEDKEDKQVINQGKASKKGRVTRESALKRFKELSEGKIRDKKSGSFWPGLEWAPKVGGKFDLILSAEDFEFVCRHKDESRAYYSECIYQVCFEEDKVSFCTVKNKKVLYSISFDDSDFDNKLLQLSNHLRRINRFFKKLGNAINCERDGIRYGDLSDEGIEFVPRNEMRAGNGNKSSEKLVNIIVSSDYRFVTLKTQNNSGNVSEKLYDLSDPKNAESLFSVYDGYQDYREHQKKNDIDSDDDIILECKEED